MINRLENVALRLSTDFASATAGLYPKAPHVNDDKHGVEEHEREHGDHHGHANGGADLLQLARLHLALAPAVLVITNAPGQQQRGVVCVSA